MSKDFDELLRMAQMKAATSIAAETRHSMESAEIAAEARRKIDKDKAEITSLIPLAQRVASTALDSLIAPDVVVKKIVRDPIPIQPRGLFRSKPNTPTQEIEIMSGWKLSRKLGTISYRGAVSDRDPRDRSPRYGSVTQKYVETFILGQSGQIIVHEQEAFSSSEIDSLMRTKFQPDPQESTSDLFVDNCQFSLDFEISKNQLYTFPYFSGLTVINSAENYQPGYPEMLNRGLAEFVAKHSIAI